VLAFGVEHPADHAVVDEYSDGGAEGSGGEDGAGRDVHVVTDFHVLEIELGSVPSISCDGTAVFN
jgi:hypothetical protein